MHASTIRIPWGIQYTKPPSESLAGPTIHVGHCAKTKADWVTRGRADVDRWKCLRCVPPLLVLVRASIPPPLACFIACYPISLASPRSRSNYPVTDQEARCMLEYLLYVMLCLSCHPFLALFGLSPHPTRSPAIPTPISVHNPKCILARVIVQ